MYEYYVVFSYGSTMASMDMTGPKITSLGQVNDIAASIRRKLAQEIGIDPGKVLVVSWNVLREV